MAFTNAWDETIPAGTRNANLGDDDIRQFKLDIRERLAVDHVMTGSDGATTGYHKVTNLTVQSTPSAIADLGQIYTKDVSSKAELHFQDEDGNELQITSAGALAVPVGSIVLWDGAGCPTGWTLLTSYDDLFLVGSGTAGTTLGSNTVDISHTHGSSAITVDSHTHTVPASSTGWGSGAATAGKLTTGQDGGNSATTDKATATASANGVTGSTDSGGDTTHDNRPAGKTIKLCQKD